MVDPMGEKAPSWTSYRYAYNNPIRIIDLFGLIEEDVDLAKTYARKTNRGSIFQHIEEGVNLSESKDNENSDWVPDSKGNLVAEKGDNAKTMAKNYGYTEKQASEMIKDSKVKLDKDGNVVEGQNVKVSNRFTEIVAKSFTIEIGEVMSNGVVQNCHGMTCNEGGYLFEAGMDYHLDNSYVDASGKMKPLETVIRWGGRNLFSGTNNNNVNNHTATVYGFSKNGTMYLATVNGAGAHLQFIKFEDVKSYFNESTIKGTQRNPTFSGYYNLKRN